MKIQLDKTALAYLWENSGTEFHLELQSSVTQWFANKYLKSLFSIDFVEKAVEQLKIDINQKSRELRQYVDRQIKFQINETLSLTEHMEDERYETKHPFVKKMVSKLIEEHVEKYTVSQIQQKLQGVEFDNLLNKIIENRTKDLLTFHIQKDLEAKIKAELINKLNI